MQKFVNPYSALGPKSFWRSGVAEKINLTDFDLYKKKFEIHEKTSIATAGSCFAQHIGNRLKENGFNVLDYEPIPFWSFPHNERANYGYCTYSARYGNIYTVRQMLQLVKEAFGIYSPKDIVWETKSGKFIDALRPGIHSDGLDSHEEVLFHRKFHITKVRELFKEMELLIFTLGLTEAWRDKESGTVFPTVPGSIGGSFDDDKYEFVNFTYGEIKEDLIELMDILDSKTFRKKYLFTVSPVPLTATATNNHVLVATTYSKSVLRSVVGEIYEKYDNVEYFPSYEIVINPWTELKKFATNQRNVLPTAVDEVMRIFLNEHNNGLSVVEAGMANYKFASGNSYQDLVCEEILLDLLNEARK